MSRAAFTATATATATVLSLLLTPAACTRQAPPPAAADVAPARPADSPPVEEDAFGWFNGKTHLAYDASHGNQIWYQDPSGRFFLWYPGNRGVVAGDSRVTGPERVCFRYDNEDTYNPVTGEYSHWECWSLRDLMSTQVDAVPGDVFDLATGRVPFRLPAHPRFDSIADVKAPR